MEPSEKRNTTNVAKGTTDPRVEFISQVQTQILIKFHLQNLDQASTSKSQPKISLSIKFKLQNLDQTQLQNLDQDSTWIQHNLYKYQQKKLSKLQLQILSELQLQNFDQTLCSKSEQKFYCMTKPQVPNLQQTIANTIHIINISNKNNLNKF